MTGMIALAVNSAEPDPSEVLMSSKLKSVLVAAVSIAFLCAALARNSNANAANPAAVAPTADELLALDKQATEAYQW